MAARTGASKEPAAPIQPAVEEPFTVPAEEAPVTVDADGAGSILEAAQRAAAEIPHHTLDAPSEG